MRNISQNFTFGNQWSFGDPFTIIIDTRNTKTGGSASNEFLFPQDSNTLDSYINFLVDWGDGQFSRITSQAQATVPHTYATPGVYTINFYKPKGVTTILSPRYENYPNETNKLLKVLRWGQFNNTRGAFQGCVNLDLVEVEGTPIFNGNAESNFRNCTNITTIKGLNSIIFSGAFIQVFYGCVNFNQACTLNVTSATSTTHVFYGCSKLNSQVIINAPNTITLQSFFQNCTTLNVLPIFNTPNVTNVSDMFNGCTAFNKDVSTMLDWSKVTNMTRFMFGKSSANYSATYYDKLLIALDAGGQSNVTLGMGTIKHTSAGLAAKNNLIAKGWTITDGGV